MWIAIALLACKQPATDTGPAADQPFQPDISTSTCGLDAYDWLDASRLGEVVDLEEDPTLSLSADTIRLLLDSQGLDAFSDRVLYDVRTWRVRYLTQDQGELVEATGFVSLPDVDAEVPTLLWLHPTMGFSDGCAPTAIGLEGAAFPVLFASIGMAVAAPDYLGMAGWGEASHRLHPYIVSEPTAVASLDGLRALFRLVDDQQLSVHPDPDRLVHWGASEGGFAALWTDRYQPVYAPEFNTVAVAATVAPTDPAALATRAVTHMGDTTFGLAGVLIGEAAWYGDRADLSAVLQPDIAAALPGELGASCDDFPSVEDVQTIEQMYTDDFIQAASDADWEAIPDFGCYLTQSRLHTSPIPYQGQAPVLMVLAEDDDLVWSTPTRDDIPQLCEQGYTIEHVECAGAGHVDGALDSLPYQLDWIQSRLEGEPLGQTCVITDPVDCTTL